MVLSRRHWSLLVLPLVLLLLLTACERPLASNDSETAEQAAEATAVAETVESEATAEQDENTSSNGNEAVAEEAAAESGDEIVEEAVSSDPDVGGGTPEMAAEEEAAAEEEMAESEESEQATTDAEVAAEETSEEEATTDEGSEVTEGADQAESSEETAADEEAMSEEAADSATAEVDEAESQDEATTAENSAATTSSTLPATHTVAPGENLYRIGLKYGMSWVTLAAYNHLPNANYIRVGQVLWIPGGGPPSPTPPPTNPDEPGYTNYVVQRGDTLNSIGRKFGVSWVEIAEANGIVNPNLIYAGQVLKIPTSQPEAPPAVTHTVRPGETLYRISLQYGVHWLSIAQVNKIPPPYVIYPGQVLVTPSG